MIEYEDIYNRGMMNGYAKATQEYIMRIDGIRADHLKEVEALRKDAWQPIETAPKDCAFLGYRKIASNLWWIAPMYWSDPEFLFLEFHSDNTEHSAKPTHWMPLPATPQVIDQSIGLSKGVEG